MFNAGLGGRDATRCIDRGVFTDELAASRVKHVSTPHPQSDTRHGKNRLLGNRFGSMHGY